MRACVESTQRESVARGGLDELNAIRFGEAAA
jgi:hypothetical protein